MSVESKLVPTKNSEGVDKSGDFGRRAIVSPDARIALGAVLLGRLPLPRPRGLGA